MQRIAMPGLAWRGGSIHVALDGRPRLVYRLPAGGRSNLAEHKDDRGRLAIEAFSALDLAGQYAALDRVIGAGDGEPDQASLRAALGDLVAFLEEFGPLGIGWGMVFPVEIALP